jgi:hemoglobin
MKRFSVVALVGTALLAGACASQMDGGMSPGMAKKSLYDRLGQKPAITAVVEDFVANVAADPRINKRFAGANIPRLKTMLVDQICEATGGPCKYTGRDMKSSHTGMMITEAEWTATVEALVKTLNKYKVPEQEQKELLGILGPMKPDIVGI